VEKRYSGILPQEILQCSREIDAKKQEIDQEKTKSNEKEKLSHEFQLKISASEIELNNIKNIAFTEGGSLSTEEKLEKLSLSSTEKLEKLKKEFYRLNLEELERIEREIQEGKEKISSIEKDIAHIETVIENLSKDRHGLDIKLDEFSSGVDRKELWKREYLPTDKIKVSYFWPFFGKSYNDIYDDVRDFTPYDFIPIPFHLNEYNAGTYKGKLRWHAFIEKEYQIAPADINQQQDFLSLQGEDRQFYSRSHEYCAEIAGNKFTLDRSGKIAPKGTKMVYSFMSDWDGAQPLPSISISHTIPRKILYAADIQNIEAQKNKISQLIDKERGKLKKTCEESIALKNRNQIKITRCEEIRKECQQFQKNVEQDIERLIKNLKDQCTDAIKDIEDHKKSIKKSEEQLKNLNYKLSSLNIKKLYFAVLITTEHSTIDLLFKFSTLAVNSDLGISKDNIGKDSLLIPNCNQFISYYESKKLLLRTSAEEDLKNATFLFKELEEAKAKTKKSEDEPTKQSASEVSNEEDLKNAIFLQQDVEEAKEKKSKDEPTKQSTSEVSKKVVTNDSGKLLPTPFPLLQKLPTIDKWHENTNHIDFSRWYTDQDINDYVELVIRHELQDYKATCNFLLKNCFFDEENGFSYHVMVTSAVAVAVDTTEKADAITMWFDKSQLFASVAQDERRDVFDELSFLKSEKICYVKILFPYNRTQSHWLTGEIQIHKNQNEYITSLAAHDPYGKGKFSKDNFDNLTNLIKKRISSLDPQATFEFNNKESHYSRRQLAGDAVSCGVIVADEIVKRIQGKSLTVSVPYEKYAKELRQKIHNKFCEHLPANNLTRLNFMSRNIKQISSSDNTTKSSMATTSTKARVLETADAQPSSFVPSPAPTTTTQESEKQKQTTNRTSFTLFDLSAISRVISPYRAEVERKETSEAREKKYDHSSATEVETSAEKLSSSEKRSQ